MKEKWDLNNYFDTKLKNIIITLLIIGLLAIFSASVPMCISKNLGIFYYFNQHILWLIFGIIGCYFFSRFDYKDIFKYAFPFTIFVIILLLLVEFTPLGVNVNGATRWLNLGIFRFQPSELTKLATILLTASIFSIKKTNILQVLIYGLSLSLMIFVVFKQPNLSMTLILLGIIFSMYIFSGKTMKYLYICFAILLCFLFMIKVHTVDITKYLQPHQIERVKSFLNIYNGKKLDTQGNGYQVYHSLIAITSGGFLGHGYGWSKEKLGWLPEAHTDFIFSVIAEEMGFVGAMIVILLFIALLYRGMHIAYNCRNVYGKLLAAGITISIVMQAFTNIAVATAFFPATGVTLPFISYGGSSLFVTLSMIGILFNIAKQNISLRQIKYKNNINEICTSSE